MPGRTEAGAASTAPSALANSPRARRTSWAIERAQLGRRRRTVEVGLLDPEAVALLAGEQYLSLDISAGEVVALVGATGAGKSTLAGLLPRLVDTDHGSVQLHDGTGWHDVRDFELDSLRRRVHVVPQETFLFSDTLANNLRLAAPHASDAELLEAFVWPPQTKCSNLKDGLDTKIGDRGVTFRAASASASALPARLLSRRFFRCWCWTTPPARWTP